MVQGLHEGFYMHVQLKGQFDMVTFMSGQADKTTRLQPG